jgi:hypothetical protein
MFGNHIGAPKVKVGLIMELKVNNKVSLSKPQSVPPTTLRMGNFWMPFFAASTDCLFHELRVSHQQGSTIRKNFTSQA